MNPTALAIHKKNTQHYIENNPTSIVLMPSVDTWSGGTRILSDRTQDDPNPYHVDSDGNPLQIPFPRAAQDFKIIWSGGTGIVVDSLGITHKFDFILVGAFDAELAIGDHWSVGAQKFNIEYIYPYNGYEVKGGGLSIGGHP